MSGSTMLEAASSNMRLVDPSRRAILVGAGIAAALGTAGPVLAARKECCSQNPNAKDLVSAAEHCEDVGEACLAHCFEMFKVGDTSLAECAVAVDNTIAVCSTTAKLGVNNSPHLKHMASVCKGVCEDCEKECLKHAKKHAICKDMADACKATIKECEKIMG